MGRIMRATLVALRYQFGVERLQEMYEKGEITPRMYDSKLMQFAHRRDQARAEVGRAVTQGLYRLMYRWMRRWLNLDDL